MAIDERELDDAFLVEAAQQGDADAFTELFRRHYPMVRRVCTRRLGSAAEADEIAQAAFVRAYERIDQCVGERRFGAWVQVIAYRLGADTRRSQARSLPTEEPIGGDAALGPNHCEDALLRSEQAAEVHEVLATLPPRQREVIVARDIEGQRPGEIAASLGLTLSAVDSLLLRARRRVAVAWRAGRPEGGLVTTHVASASLAATTAAASVTDPASLRFLSRLGDAIARATYRVAGGVGVLPGPTTLAQRLGGVAAAGVIVAAPLAAALPSPAASVTAAPAVHRSAPIIDIVASALHQATTVRLPHAQPVPLTVTMPTIKAPPVQLPSGALPSAPSGHLPPVALPSAGSVDANQVTSGLATATNGLQTTISGVTATVSGVTSTLTRPGVAPPFASAVVGGATTVVRGATHTVTGVAGTLGIAR